MAALACSFCLLPQSLIAFSNYCTHGYIPSLPKFTLLSQLQDDHLEAHKMRQQRALQSAMHSATLRLRGGLRTEPLVYDPYAACLAGSDLLDGAFNNGGLNIEGICYELATTFIDEKVLVEVQRNDVITRQIVLLTDGMDTRPYRLPWPPATMIFDVSTDSVFKLAEERLSAAGAKVPKMCLLRHVSAEMEEFSELQEGWSEALKGVGYQGDKPSIWVMQGLDHLTWSGLQGIMSCVSSLAMKGTFFVGQFPLGALCDVSQVQEKGKNQLEKVFMSHGLSVCTISYEQLALDFGFPQSNSTFEKFGCERLLFVARQLRLSDDQVEKARREIELAEESGDEESFEDW